MNHGLHRRGHATPYPRANFSQPVLADLHPCPATQSHDIVSPPFSQLLNIEWRLELETGVEESLDYVVDRCSPHGHSPLLAGVSHALGCLRSVERMGVDVLGQAVQKHSVLLLAERRDVSNACDLALQRRERQSLP